jgi:hypothetical protein
MTSEIFVGVSTRIFTLVSITFSRGTATGVIYIRETTFDSVMANAVIIGYVCILHERDPISWSQNKHHTITTTTGVWAPGFQGGSPLRVVHETKGDVVIPGHLVTVADRIEGRSVVSVILSLSSSFKS